MIEEALKIEEGIKFNGVNVTDLRNADDAVLVADKRKNMQKMINRLNETCKAYGMEINVKTTKVMIINKKEKQKGMQCCIMLNIPLEQVTRFKYLGSWITEYTKSDENIRTRVG